MGMPRRWWIEDFDQRREEMIKEYLNAMKTCPRCGSHAFYEINGVANQCCVDCSVLQSGYYAAGGPYIVRDSSGMMRIEDHHGHPLSKPWGDLYSDIFVIDSIRRPIPGFARRFFGHE